MDGGRKHGTRSLAEHLELLFSGTGVAEDGKGGSDGGGRSQRFPGFGHGGRRHRCRRRNAGDLPATEM